MEEVAIGMLGLVIAIGLVGIGIVRALCDIRDELRKEKGGHK